MQQVAAKPDIKAIIEAALMAFGQPLTIERLQKLFPKPEMPSAEEIRNILKLIAHEYENRPLVLKEVASGFRFQVKNEFTPWLQDLWAEKATRYSRAFLETLALIAYRQPITRAEIEAVRGVAVSSQIIKTMLERNWIKVVGHRDLPGKPALYATTKEFLNDFNLKSLEELPMLAELKDIDKLDPQLDLNVNAVSEQAVEVETVNEISFTAEAVEVETVEFDESEIENAD